MQIAQTSKSREAIPFTIRNDNCDRATYPEDGRLVTINFFARSQQNESNFELSGTQLEELIFFPKFQLAINYTMATYMLFPQVSAISAE